MDVEGCLACDFATGRQSVPGGIIHETDRWVVDHCVGPLGVGTLIVAPRRHVTHVSELDDAEVAELGPLLKRTAAAVQDLAEADQVYVCLWSHAGGEPVHIHFVVQPAEAPTEAQPLYGPSLQVAMFQSGELPPPDEVETFAERARAALGGP